MDNQTFELLLDKLKKQDEDVAALRSECKEEFRGVRETLAEISKREAKIGGIVIAAGGIIGFVIQVGIAYFIR